MLTRTSLRLAVCAILTLTSSAGAGASTLRVPADLPTIGSAIALAGPGDTIRVSAGAYAEQLVIPASKAGLRVKGIGTVILDPTGVGSGAALTIEAPDVRIESLTIRHASDDGGDRSGIGVLVAGGAARTELQKLSVLHCETMGITIWAPGVRVTACRVLGGVRGIVNYHHDGLIQGCEIRLVQAGGILVFGDRTKLIRNEVHGVAVGSGITAFGIDSVAERNRISNASTGLRLEDRGAVARKNEISGCSRIGLFLVSSAGRAERNKITDCVGTGLWVRGSQAVVLKNQVERCADGFLVEADDVTVHDNSARENLGDGFRVLGHRALLSDNRATLNLVDGFDLEQGTASELTRNLAMRNHAEGIENNASATVMQLNSCRKNRVDVAMDALPDRFVKNVYRTGGPETPPAVD